MTIFEHDLAQAMSQAIVAGLRRKVATKCSKWAETYRVMGTPFPGPWTFDHHPWLLEIHDCDAAEIVVQKAAQMGYTEWAINRAFYSMDILGLDVLYVLPTSHDATDFSMSRFNPALEMSPHLREFFSDVNNTGLKRARNTTLYVRGSKSRSKLKSIPTAVIILDEIDEMPKASISLVEERMSGQAEGSTQLLKLSTPSFEDFGINTDYKMSTQDRFVFQCPCCSRFTHLCFPDCLEITADKPTDPGIKDSYLKCKECGGRLENKKEYLKPRQRGGTAHFVPTFKNRDKKGFHISQLYSMAQAGNPTNLAIAALLGEQDPTRKQEFYNSKLGETFEDEGVQITDELITSSIGDFKSYITDPTRVRTMGIDVGKVLHIVVYEWTPVHTNMPLSINDRFSPRLILATESSGAIDDYQEALKFFDDLQCSAAIIDAEPERRMSMKFIQHLPYRAFMCDYLYSVQSRTASFDDDEQTIKVNRTAWLDLTFSRFRSQKGWIAKDVPSHFRDHIKASKRIHRIDKWGQSYGVYVNEKADHFAHACNYAELALPVALGQGSIQNITNLYK